MKDTAGLSLAAGRRIYLLQKAMKTSILLIAFSLSWSITSTKADPRPTFAIPSVQWAEDPSQAACPEKDGVALSVSVPKQGGLGEPFRIKVSVINHSQQPAFYEEVSGGPNFHVALRDSEGKAIPLTRYGHVRFPPEYAVKEPFITAAVPMGETRSFLLNLPRCYDLSLAGEYRVSVTADINPAGFQGFSLKSPPIGFTMKDVH